MKFKNEKVQVTLEKKPACQAEAKIAVSPQMASDHRKKAFKAIRKEVSLPGFRKGRAPEDVIEQRYESDIRREFLRTVVDDAVKEALTLTETFPFSRNEKVKIDTPEIDEKEGGNVTVRYEYYPDVPSIDLQSVKVDKVAPKEVSEQMIKDNLYNIRITASDLKEVTDRPAEKEDVVTIKMEGAKNSDYQWTRHCHLHKDDLPKWLIDPLVGKKVGEKIEGVKRGNKTFDPQMPTEISIEILKILTGEILPLDDELAKKYKMENVEQLKQKVEEQIDAQLKNEAHQLTRDAVSDHLRKSYTFEIPQSLLQAEKDYRISQLKEESPKDNEVEKEAEAALRLQFLLSNLASEKELHPTEEMIQYRALTQLSQYYQLTQQQPDEEFFNRIKARARHDLTMESALDYVIDNMGKTSSAQKNVDED